jgi:hypothetical protein
LKDNHGEAGLGLARQGEARRGSDFFMGMRTTEASRGKVWRGQPGHGLELFRKEARSNKHVKARRGGAGRGLARLGRAWLVFETCILKGNLGWLERKRNR